MDKLAMVRACYPTSTIVEALQAAMMIFTLFAVGESGGNNKCLITRKCGQIRNEKSFVLGTLLQNFRKREYPLLPPPTPSSSPVL